MFKTIISKLNNRNANTQPSQHESAHQACTMESMEGRTLMAVNAFFEGVGETSTTGSTVTYTYTVTNPAPTTGILIGLLLPAVQQTR
jgi:hypothetical protein